MSRRIRRESIELHRAWMQQVLSCVLIGNVSIGRYSLVAAVDVRSVQLNGGARTAMPGTSLRLRVVQQILARQQVTSVNVIVTGYNYTIEHLTEGELVSFQWHPGGDSSVEFPHVHVGPGLVRRDSVVRSGEAHKIHVPTGEVSLTDVVQLAITEFGVAPRRDDWDEVLSRPGVVA